ncbi:AMP-binding protein [Aquimarina sp. 2201CG1-2-11]|uniref:AMP-binding protein n=1 Tax=Aquimarina discodermiae TaxID=3231043 RepID=UPI0034624F83
MNNYTCTNCSNEFSISHIDETSYALECKTCHTIVPSLNGIIYFNKIEINTFKNIESYINECKSSLEKKRVKYQDFLDLKLQKSSLDIYSAFQPFNESSRAFYPFILELKKALKPGDVILDTWCRTGFSTYFLSALFPDQKIISVWEGDRDVLGHAGFDYWLSGSTRPDNVEIIFSDLNRKIPLKNDSVSLVYGLDTLHRYDQTRIVSELNRITKHDGFIIFPHVHLKNSEPIPFFERGEKQLFGKDYHTYFERFFNERDHHSYILSEPELFELTKETHISNNPESIDYNALIALIPKKYENFILTPFDFLDFDTEHLRILTNPLFSFDLSTQTATINKDESNGMVGHLLDRHQVYLNKLLPLKTHHLTTNQACAIFLGNKGNSLKEISETLQVNINQLILEIKELAALEIIHVLPLHTNTVRLQQYHSNNPFNLPLEIKATKDLLKFAEKKYVKTPIIYDSTDQKSLQIEEINFLIDALHKKLINDSISTTENIVICSKIHFEAIILYWATTSLGIPTIILHNDMPTHAIQNIINDHSPEIIFTDQDTEKKFSENFEQKVVIFDPQNESNKALTGNQLFSNWIYDLDSSNIISHEILHKPQDVSTILFTSGTTGKPKGVKLSHQALISSAKCISQTFKWSSKDRILITSGIDTMSGLRNICLAPLFSGVSIIIPKIDDNFNIFGIIKEIERNKVSIITATPSLIHQFLGLGKKIIPQLESLKQVICTGAFLEHQYIENFEKLFDIRILNYYGLTETSGICLSEPIGIASNKKGSLGIAIDSIVQIVDDNDNLVAAGEVGNLRVFSNRNFSGYLDSEIHSGVRFEKGFVYTNDLAYKDNDDYFYLKGRRKNFVKNGNGNIIYSENIKNCILKNKAVEHITIHEIIENGIEQFTVNLQVNDIVSKNSQLELDIRKSLNTTFGNENLPKIVISIK